MTPLGCAGASANSQSIADKYNPTLDVFDDPETDLNGSSLGARVWWVREGRTELNLGIWFAGPSVLVSSQVMRPLDTSPAADERYHELLRRMPPEKRLEAAMRLSVGVRELALAGIRQRFPFASDEELRVRLAVRLYGRASVARAFRDIPPDAT